jgi:hypothetical protein
MVVRSVSYSRRPTALCLSDPKTWGGGVDSLGVSSRFCLFVLFCVDEMLVMGG